MRWTGFEWEHWQTEMRADGNSGSKEVMWNKDVAMTLRDVHRQKLGTRQVDN